MGAKHVSYPGSVIKLFNPHVVYGTVLQVRMLIYNGDADACVPYKGNEEWITSLVNAGNLAVKEAWHPWYNDQWPNMPAGYLTTYNVTGAPASKSQL